MKKQTRLYTLEPIEKFITFHMRTEDPSIKQVKIKGVDNNDSFGLESTIELTITRYNGFKAKKLDFLKEYGTKSIKRCMHCKKVVSEYYHGLLCEQCYSDLNG